MDCGTPVDLRELFARPWSGPVTMSRPRWLRWLPTASPVHFRTEISGVDSAESIGLIVHDTMTFAHGKTWQRTMTARLLEPGHWRITAKDMPGGTEQWVTADGFRFAPYTILAPVLGPIRVPLRCEDEVQLLDAKTMIDEVKMTFLGIPVGTIEMRLSAD